MVCITERRTERIDNVKINHNRTAKCYGLKLNLNGVLVTRQTDNISQGGAPGGKLVPGSHKRHKLGHTVIRHFSRGDRTENQGGHSSP